MEFNHKSVLLNETIEGLMIKPEGTYVDGTLGGAGHSLEIVKKLNSQGRLIGFDQDEEAIKASGERLKDFSNVTIIRSNYRYMKEELNKIGVTKVDGIMLDLGVSSHQLDTIERGFSYRFDAPLDMRMDNRKSLTAKDIVNTYSQGELRRIIQEYGEDKFAANIAKHIVAYRENKEIETTGELVEIIKASIPMKIQKNMGHPAKQTFQALRIELNEELTVLSETLDEMIEMLNPEGRIGVITFHSLEDRIVKSIFKRAEDPCTCPKSLPMCICGKKPKGKVITKKPILPTEIEMDENPRSKSAKLRVFERGKEL
ncbi:MAG: 16S rRNA (cytosine(1402)-N(4))-methyltransferase RsmH [Lachnospiraceae bacterium]|nr:16S rRNA (cytosine(1402)-N(4))-methyltransferase RsmH [Lachnospiraceae bacterium]